MLVRAGHRTVDFVLHRGKGLGTSQVLLIPPRPGSVAAMDLNAVKEFKLAPVVHRYSVKDSILYALGLGYGERPTDPQHLQFVYEKGIKAVPSACVVLAHPGFWVNEPSLKIDWIKILHGEQAFEILRPLPTEGVVRGEYEILALEDKGKEKGAVMHVVKRLYDESDGALIANVTSVYMLRGDGGQGGFGQAPAAQRADLPAVRRLQSDTRGPRCGEAG